MSNLDCFHCGDNHPSSSCLLHDAGRDAPHGRDARGRAYTCEKAARLFAEMDATESAVMSPADDPAHVPDENPYLLPLLDAVPDVPPATPLADHIKAGMLRGRVRLPDEPDEVCPKCGRPRGDVDVAVVLPDVPPDPPVADRDELARWFATRHRERAVEDGDYAEADALLSSGRLVDTADVRARARVDTLNELADFFMTRDGSGYVVEEICRRIEGDRAVSEREGAS